MLARAALDAAEDAIKDLESTSPVFRVFFVLNTDGEARDGVEATTVFIEGYKALLSKYPTMQQARTFVLGIGA